MDDSGVTIWASELASAIGRHKYKRREDTFRQVWLRSDRRSFCLAHSLMFKKEIISLIAASKESESLQPLPDVETERNSAQFLELMKKIILDTKFRKLFFEILNFIKGMVIESERERQTLAGTSKDLYQQVVLQTKALCKDERKTVATAMKELSKAGEQSKEVKAAVESKLTKDRGTHLESKAIQDFGKAKGIEVELVQEETCYKSVEYNGLKWMIGGRVDMEMQECIVEVKNRKARFFPHIPEYDYLQLQTYMWLRDKPRGILLERLRGQNRETPFTFDDLSWKEEIIPELAVFVSEVSSCIEEYKQDLHGASATSPCSSPTPKRRRPNNADSAKEEPCDAVAAGDREAEKENMELA